MSHATATQSVMMEVPGVGAFVRALLPINLTGEHKLTYGVWLAIDPRELPGVFDVWWEPGYAQLQLAGLLANVVQPWGMLGSPVLTEVRDPDQTPYCASSTDPTLNGVLTEHWDHDLVLGPIGNT
ncbi:MAG TPA: hypothetical protein VGD55_10650 [Acidothermaceae bacterium]